jgi:hypothetical protein
LLDALKGPVLAVPLVGLAPFQLLFAGEALAVQLVALVELHVNVEAAPFGTESGLALNDTVRAGSAVTVTITDLDTSPPAPRQVSVNVLVAVSAPVD